MATIFWPIGWPYERGTPVQCCYCVFSLSSAEADQEVGDLRQKLSRQEQTLSNTAEKLEREISETQTRLLQLETEKAKIQDDKEKTEEKVGCQTGISLLCMLEFVS